MPGKQRRMGLGKPSRKQVKVLISFKKRGQIGLFEVIYTDFTEIPYDGGKRNAQLIAIEAWRRTKETFKGYGISLKGMILHQDRDSVFTGNRWVDEILIKEGVRLSYSENGVKCNTYMESFNGHFKCPNRSIFCEAKDINGLSEVVQERVHYWNRTRRHSSLDYRTPLNYIK